MTKTIKTIATLILITILITVSTFTFYSSAFNPDDYDPAQVQPMTSGDQKIIVDKTSNILTYIRYIGIVLATIVLSVIGLKYILASADEKASYKENMVPYVVGCLLLMGVTIIPSIVYQAMN